MFPVERALLIINRTAGTGDGAAVAQKLAWLFKRGLEELSHAKVEMVNDHAAARACAADFISESEAPALIVAGGGGGTLRAVIEGICDSRSSVELPGPQRVCVGALRMGSGNVLAKQFGAPKDPVAGLDGLISNLKAGRTAPCCVMRCETWARSGERVVHHAVTLGGLGQFGRIPSDLARWHASFPSIHKSVARLLGVETLTDVEYALALLIRSISCTIFPERAEMVEIQFQDQTQRFRLLSGIVMNFPIPALPFKPGVTVEDEALSVYLIPFKDRFSPLQQIVAPQELIPHARFIRLEKTQRLEIRLVDRDSVELFLDEDPVTTYRQLSLGVAGSIAFVPGLDYRGVSR